jgi:16S rRNA (uracil1498-N3)-methyltransferase
VSDRFYLDDDLQQESAQLTGPEAHHLTHVLRKRVGDAVTVFDGRGWEATGEVVAANRRAVILRLSDVRELPPPQGPHVTLAVAVPKQDRFRWLAEKAMELGVRRLIPLQTERSVVEPGGGKLDKIRRAVVEAAKQCGASHLTAVDELTLWSDFAGRAFQLDQKQDDGPGTPSFGRVFIAHPGGHTLREAVGGITPADSLCFVIGPEGGFTDDEVAQATNAGAIPVGLGPHILRIETAAIAVAAWVRLWTA